MDDYSFEKQFIEDKKQLFLDNLAKYIYENRTIHGVQFLRGGLFLGKLGTINSTSEVNKLNEDVRNFIYFETYDGNVFSYIIRTLYEEKQLPEYWAPLYPAVVDSYETENRLGIKFEVVNTKVPFFGKPSVTLRVKFAPLVADFLKALEKCAEEDGNKVSYYKFTARSDSSNSTPVKSDLESDFTFEIWNVKRNVLDDQLKRLFSGTRCGLKAVLDCFCVYATFDK